MTKTTVMENSHEAQNVEGPSVATIEDVCVLEKKAEQHTRALKPVMIIADDFAISEGVSDAILDLVNLHRLSGFSCMVNFAEWQTMGARITWDDRLYIGLHLNLTAGPPLTSFPLTDRHGEFQGLKALVKAAVLNRLDHEALKREIAAQIKAFAEVTHHLPMMIDGHQHAHALPQVRMALLEVLDEMDPERRILLRDPVDSIWRLLRRPEGRAKALFMRWLAGGFGRKARAMGWQTNWGFSGYSVFDHLEDYAPVFRSALRGLGPKPMVMVHPGHARDAGLLGRDNAIATRPMEYGYLKSHRFLEDMALAGLKVALRPTNKA